MESSPPPRSATRLFQREVGLSFKTVKMPAFEGEPSVRAAFLKASCPNVSGETDPETDPSRQQRVSAALKD